MGKTLSIVIGILVFIVLCSFIIYPFYSIINYNNKKQTNFYTIEKEEEYLKYLHDYSKELKLDLPNIKNLNYICNKKSKILNQLFFINYLDSILFEKKNFYELKSKINIETNECFITKNSYFHEKLYKKLNQSTYDLIVFDLENRVRKELINIEKTISLKNEFINSLKQEDQVNLDKKEMEKFLK